MQEDSNEQGKENGKGEGGGGDEDTQKGKVEDDGQAIEDAFFEQGSADRK